MASLRSLDVARAQQGTVWKGTSYGTLSTRGLGQAWPDCLVMNPSPNALSFGLLPTVHNIGQVTERVWMIQALCYQTLFSNLLIDWKMLRYFKGLPDSAQRLEMLASSHLHHLLVYLTPCYVLTRLWVSSAVQARNRTHLQHSIYFYYSQLSFP